MTGRPRIVVLDDDPTGTQTVHGVPVLTTWSPSALENELRQSECFFILTNSRALSAKQSRQLHVELLANLHQAARGAGYHFEIVSRSDSTLRGHYPMECDVITDSYRSAGTPVDGTLIVPCFPEGGRITVDDIHYALINGKRVPVGDTEFARDQTFGFTNSNLRDWVAEKTAGRTPASDVVSLTPALEDVAARLKSLPHDSVIIVNAESYDDLNVLVAGIQQSGRRYLYRSAASLVKALAGVSERPLLVGTELRRPDSGGGLIVVGSHTAKTTAQLEQLLALDSVTGIELRVPEILEGNRDAETGRVLADVESCLRAGKSVALYTSRDLYTGTVNQADSALSSSVSVSKALTSVIGTLDCAPAFLIAKGGITSSDVATIGLGVKRAVVLGQALPGVPVWQCGPETRFPSLPYIVFPGNVGDQDALRNLVKTIT